LNLILCHYLGLFNDIFLVVKLYLYLNHLSCY